MHIHEVIIDGFKSYAQRTVVSGFDPQFNAITGLNGTGKSNILDSICFVLGISNLTQVRVGNLQELVYKQGQAGVTKASVTIVFNNTDPTCSPVGYESHRQITVTRQVVIGGKNKYIINGHTVQQSQVQNLFHSVQLNVNNPHFLIMQGRITKVLNMKPVETLSMIEEAAGTRMFETKKQAAQKTIEKKQLKVDEITKCINEEITPTLENLREERQGYQTWLSNNTEVERLERFCIALDYMELDKVVNSNEDGKASLVDQQEEQQNIITAKTEEAAECAKRIVEIERQRGEESEGPMKALKVKENELSKELVKKTTLYENHKEGMVAEQDVNKQLSKQIDATLASMEEKKAELDQCDETLAEKEKESAEAEAQSVALREKYQNACAGVADDTSTECLSLPEQVASWEKRAREAQSQLQQGEMKCKHINSNLKDLKKTLKQQQASHDKTQKEADKLKDKVSSAERLISSSQYDEGKETMLRTTITETKASVAEARDLTGTLSAQLKARLAFDYKDPERGFNRSRVKGLLANLFTVKDATTATALEIAAGAKLFQIVVDNEHTGKLLLQKGQLKKRVTILPLNKVDNRCMDPKRLQAAKDVAKARGGMANLALELVDFPPEVQSALEFTYGNVIICDKPEVAKAIAFDRNIRAKTVTYEGDVYDPSGTLTGGAKNELGKLLSKIAEKKEAQSVLQKGETDLAELTKQLKSMEALGMKLKDVLGSLEMDKHALQMCEEKIAESVYGQTAAEIQAMEDQLGEFDAEAVRLRETSTQAADELKKLQNAERDIKKAREKAMKDVENQMRAAQKAASTIKSELSKLRAKRDAIFAQLESLQKEQHATKEQLEISAVGISRLEEESVRLAGQVAECRDAYDEAKEDLAEKQAELNKCSKEIKSLETTKTKAEKAAQSASLAARKLQHKIDQWEKEFKDNSRALAGLLKKHSWIQREKSFFGTPGSDFDFEARDHGEAASRLKKIKSDQDRLSKKINKKVMGMIEKAEKEYEDLNRKREVVLRDKAKIEAVIEELDVKKAQALQSTWIKVNRDFGSIFSMLLPGTQAKLEPPEDGTVMDGLEVKVAFNGVWKESLTELSGGQRSLLALSLILSLLLFKPAPMYILDEVDAALDLSHTQNIGLMLRTHFSSSQFIVVSLKEGMFNNANVIFRTRFVDGVSAVTRTVVGAGAKAKHQQAIMNGSASGTPAAEAEEAENSPVKKRGKGTKSASRRGAALAPPVSM